MADQWFLLSKLARRARWPRPQNQVSRPRVCDNVLSKCVVNMTGMEGMFALAKEKGHREGSSGD